MLVVDAFLGAMEMLDPVKELPGNRGYFVDAINEDAGSPLASAWCLNTVGYAGRHVIGKRWPLPRTGSCDELLRFAKAKGIVRDKPVRGAIFLKLNPANPNDATHAGAVLEVLDDGRFGTWEGNSNDTGSREGTDVVHLTRNPHTAHYVFIDWEALVDG